ncbi:LysE family transporter [Shewanella psychropiezotolerans]|uniref:LysE family transporter n=1 Tax=Shewanella psychropiezotolerans TaxID=2593655 RepID=UPI00389A1C37
MSTIFTFNSRNRYCFCFLLSTHWFWLWAVIQSNNTLFNAVQILGAIYLLYLSYRFISPKVKQNNNSESASNANFTFLNGVIIQLLNQKG